MSIPAEVTRRWGWFDGPVRTEWVRGERGPDRRMVLLDAVAFHRATGEVIVAPAGLAFDGASIPRWAWPVIGSPFTGDYRDGAVIHDWLCKQRQWSVVGQFEWRLRSASSTISSAVQT